MKQNLVLKSIKSWKVDDRPREKLLIKGASALSDAELIAILLGSGNREQTAVGLSKNILSSVENKLSFLAKVSIPKLMEFKGIGEAKAISIVTALELGKRRNLELAMETLVIKSSRSIFEVMQPIIGDLSHEEFWVIYLNNSNKIVSKAQMSKGGITGTLVDVRLLFKQALELSATAVILVHNHPSGMLTPSQADKRLTIKIKNAGTVLDIKVLDHLIITEKAYFSFADSSEL